MLTGSPKTKKTFWLPSGFPFLPLPVYIRNQRLNEASSWAQSQRTGNGVSESALGLCCTCPSPSGQQSQQSPSSGWPLSNQSRRKAPKPPVLTTPIYSSNETVALNSKQRDFFWDPYNLKDINFGPLQKAITSPEPKLARYYCFLLSEEQIARFWEEPCSPQLPTADSKCPVMDNQRLLAFNSHVLVPFPK